MSESQSDTQPGGSRIVTSAPWRGERLTANMIQTRFNAEGGVRPDHLGSPVDKVAGYALFALSRIALLQQSEVKAIRIGLQQAGARIAKTDEVGLMNDIARAQVFVLSDVLNLKPSKNLADYAKSVEGLHGAVAKLLQDRRLEHDPLGVTLITLEFGEVILPYVLATLTAQLGPLPADVRDSLRVHLRLAEMILTNPSRENRYGEAFKLEGGEVVHTRYYDLLTNIRATLDLVDRWR